MVEELGLVAVTPDAGPGRDHQAPDAVGLHGLEHVGGAAADLVVGRVLRGPEDAEDGARSCDRLGDGSWVLDVAGDDAKALVRDVEPAGGASQDGDVMPGL